MSTEEAETGELLRVQGPSDLQSEGQASQGSVVRPCFKQTKEKRRREVGRGREERERNTEFQDSSVTDLRASQSNQFYTKIFTCLHQLNILIMTL